MSCKSRRASRSNVFQRKALALAIGGSIAMAFSGGAFAQAVNGTIHGMVPVAPNETIQITGGAGYNRTISVGPSGQYSVILPVGTYTVRLLQNGQVVQTRDGVTATAAGGSTVDFTSATSAQNAQTLSAINVTATAIPPIDVTSTNQTTTITAKQLSQLPIGRTAEDIALLAPGVTSGAAMLGNGPTGSPLLVFGGASVAENSYFIDGMNTTDALTGQGGISLPYGAIEEQQTITSGYGARYGRSIGGVINQIGKSGSNEWHFGFQGVWQPGSLRDNPVNQLWNNPNSTTPGEMKGDLRTWNKDNHQSENIYDAYVSGPIVKDKLLFFLGVEQDNIHTNSVTPLASQSFNDTEVIHRPKIYAKINWNINENNFLTVTGAQSEDKIWQTRWNYDYDTHQTGDFVNNFPADKKAFRVWVANYTSYITDNLTLHAMLGKLHGEYYTEPPSNPLPYIFGASRQNPAFAPPGGITNTQTNADVGNPAHTDSVMNYRVDLDWKLPWNLWGTHDLEVGIDNSTVSDTGDGSVMTGPGYAWDYNNQVGPPQTAKGPGDAITGTDPSIAPYIGPPNSNPDGATGYYVSKYIFENAATVRVVQHAAYLQDNWQITPKFLLKLGIRDDTFVNYNPAGEAYIRLTKPQWEPRIGFSWDVHGDSSLKVYGNAGRYYLALPAAVALRGAGASTYTQQYFTYTGIASDGTPLGQTPIPENPIDGVSQNNAYGEPLDPRTVASTNIKAEYADAYVLGMQQKFNFLGTDWVFGANGIYKKLGRIVDDWDDQQRECAAGVAEGYAWMTPQTCTSWTLGGVLINPGETSTLMLKTPTGGLVPVSVDIAQQGFPMGVKRKYYAINLSLEHPWDGKWSGGIYYTFSRNWGNTEGPVDSVIGQGGNSVSITEQWDFYQLMEWSNGLLPNDQKHQLKAYGEYALTPQWIVGGSLFIGSGHPKDCMGTYPYPVTPDYGTGSYHFCAGVPTPPGSTGFTPWTHQLNLNVIYQPDWAQRKLAFKLDIFNVFNQQTPLQYTATYDSPSYQRIFGWTDPRYVRFSIAYNW